MLSRRALLAARTLRAYQAPQVHRQFFPVIQQFRSYADKVVKVPEMAESISEGTLKQFSKQIGDYVEQDEEIATIETDKARSSWFLLHTIDRYANSSIRLMLQLMHLKLAQLKSF